MKTYAELVKEAIREAHEKAENEYKKFEVGRTYATRSICNSEYCVICIDILRNMLYNIIVAREQQEGAIRNG